MNYESKCIFETQRSVLQGCLKHNLQMLHFIYPVLRDETDIKATLRYLFVFSSNNFIVTQNENILWSQLKKQLFFKMKAKNVILGIPRLMSFLLQNWITVLSISI